ncbi:hypothetical protein ACQEVB_11955 [Pseudonocardia sp. CA-107938]|uniref:hypothetical protein n=1 Tax=Pseudonocardia sp. CA-107938 TaxID=3240021 RepID=UPI003D910728
MSHGAAVRDAPEERLALARGVLAKAERARYSDPDPTALPVAPPLTRLLPGLRRGSTVAIPEPAGATSLLFALLAAASADGAWVGIVGRPDLGMLAAAEAGLALERVALVPAPGADVVAVTMALLDGMDVVAVAPGGQVRAAERQRLAARARQRGSVLVALGPWQGADLELRCSDRSWTGLAPGSGRLRACRAVVRRGGRGSAGRAREARLLLPGAEGRVTTEATQGAAPIRAAG